MKTRSSVKFVGLSPKSYPETNVSINVVEFTARVKIKGSFIIR